MDIGPFMCLNPGGGGGSLPLAGRTRCSRRKKTRKKGIKNQGVGAEREKGVKHAKNRKKRVSKSL